MSKRLISIKEICQFLNIGRTTLHYLRRDDPSFPKPIRVLNTPKFVYSDILQWIEDKKANQEVSA